jgi:hypothetical protein
VGAINDDINILTSSFFFLGLAGLEFSLGLLIILIFKKILKIEYFTDFDQSINTLYIDYNTTNSLKQEAI